MADFSVAGSPWGGTTVAGSGLRSGAPNHPSLLNLQSPSVSTAAETQARWLAAVLEMVGQVLVAGDLQMACDRLADELRELLSIDLVAIGLSGSGGVVCRLTAMSGTTVIEPDAPETRRIAARLADCALQRTTIDQPLPQGSGQTSTSGHTGTTLELCLPLLLRDGHLVGVCLLRGPKVLLRDQNLLRQLEVAAEPLAAALATRQPRRFASWTAAWRRVAAVFDRRRTLRGALLLAAVAVCPIADRTYCPCVVEPTTRRYVAAPFDGVLLKSLVKPGDRVTVGQLVAKLDDRQLTSELAEAKSEQERAAKARDIELAAGHIGPAQIHKLEVDRFQQRCNVLEQRLAKVELRSPLAGVVVRGDLERAEGAPVTIGQTLFEIAPLDCVTVELLFADRDLGFVAIDQQVSATFDVDPWRSWQGSLARLHPRAEVRDNANIFVGEFAIDNPTGALQPGMKGRATLYGQDRPLGWLLARNLALRLSRLAW